MKKLSFLFSVVATVLLASCCGTSEQPATADPTQAVINNILNRKSVRSYADLPVADDTIQQILRCAMAAPSAVDRRPWSFVVLKDKSRYAKVFEGNMNMQKYMESAAVIVLCADTTCAMQGSTNGERQPNSMWRDDMGAVAQNLLLATEAYGLGAVWTACYPHRDRMASVQTELALPANVLPYAIIPIGHHDGTTKPKDKFDPSRIHNERW